MQPWLEEDAAPLYVIRFPPRYGTDDIDRELRRAEDRLAEILEGRPGMRIALVVDLSWIEGSTATSRKHVAAAMRRAEKRLAGRVAAQAFITHSVVIQAATTAVFWLTRPPWPIRVFTSRVEARSWARAELGQRATAASG